MTYDLHFVRIVNADGDHLRLPYRLPLFVPLCLPFACLFDLVNESNGRYYEPAPTRTIFGGIQINWKH